MNAGYSGTPLIRKLGLKDAMSAFFHLQPDHYFALLSELPDIKQIHKPEDKSWDFIHLFTIDTSTYLENYSLLKKYLKFNGMFWISWPKKSSKLSTDIDENIIRNHALKNGLVDVKVCAIDTDWSGLKLMYREEDRT